MARRTRGWRAALCLFIPLALFASACADDDDGETNASSEGEGGGDGGVVTIFGPEVEGEAQGFIDAFAAFEEEMGIDVQYSGDRSFE